MNEKKEGKFRKSRIYCRICRNNKGMIHRYGINLCRRCFKDMAEKIGFKKYS
jgi:ribosomal protein S14